MNNNSQKIPIPRHKLKEFLELTNLNNSSISRYINDKNNANINSNNKICTSNNNDRKTNKFSFKLRMKSLYHAPYIIITFIIVIHITFAICSQWDPYEVIGVERDASLDQIKKAYRELAKKLHPDKSKLNEDEANKKFIELNKAFEILKDQEKRNKFDQYGEIDDSKFSRSHHHHHQNTRQTREYWTATNSDGRTFTFYSSSSSNADSYLRKKAITSRQYMDYTKKSNNKIYLVFFFSNFCPTCNSIESRWTKIANDLARYGVDSFSINVHHEPRLAHDLGITSIPYIAALIDGELKTYNAHDLSLANIVKFLRNTLPNNLINLLTSDEEQDKFIALGPRQNKLSAIIIHNESSLKLRYLLLAYEFRMYYRFAHISTKSCQYKTIVDKYNLTIQPSSKTSQANLLVFDENIRGPVINLNFDHSGSFDIVQIKNRLQRWPFLMLPKLSSQQKFDDLCLYTIPKDGFKTSARLCVILFAVDSPSSQPTRNKLIEFIEANGFVHDDRVSFAFIDTIKQKAFVDSLILETKETYPFKPKSDQGDQTSGGIDYSIIMIEKHQQNSRKALHRWIHYRWDSMKPDELDKAKIELHDFIMEYKRNNNIIETKLALDLLIDEDGPSLMDKIFWKFFDQLMRTTNYIISRDSFSTVSVLIMCALMTSLLLYQLPSSTGPDDLGCSITPEKDETCSPYKKSRDNYANDEFLRNRQQRTQSLRPTAQGLLEDDLKIIELKAETYNGMIRLLKPGHRSIILLNDTETRDQLMSKFKRAVWPYRRNKTLLFGYLCLDKNLDWYRNLLEQVLGVRDLNVNKKNCIGTVLSLNGYKRYLRVYHAKHHEIDRYDNETNNDGSFLGFNENDSEEDDEQDDVEKGIDCDVKRNGANSYPVENLLDRLPIWLDKVFDGLTKRYFLDSWPDVIN